jgi:hypothetical protein
MIADNKIRGSGLKIYLVAIFIFLIVGSCGCIHIDFGEPFGEPEPEITEFHVVTKEGFPIKHIFTNDEANQKHTETMPFNIKKETEWANISIKVEINNFGFINNSPINITFFEQYVYIIIEGPNEDIFFEHRYEESDMDIRPIPKPKEGVWIVRAEAKGFGNDETYDYYEVNVIAYEPK